MKYIELTQGQRAMVDDEDYEGLNQHRWYAYFNPCTQSFYARRNVYADGIGTTILMHRVILGAKKGEVVDHIDHVTLDNTKGNIRTCTHSQNGCNTRLSSYNSSGFKGVALAPRSTRYRAYITLNKKQMHLGVFDCKIEAAKVYNLASRMYHGEFSLINSMESV